MNNNYSLHDTLRENFQKNKLLDLKNTLAAREHQITILMNKVQALELQSETRAARKKSRKEELKSVVKKDLGNSEQPHKKNTAHCKSNGSTPTPSNRCRKELIPNTPSTKCSPNQLRMSEMPENFKHTKVFFF
ncbi:hypothetical protein O181_040858 [Austropuccinia psidii MF-1]|uniref:Uncharacterized protein n=1 Tax=Austropuccinia psidii MF-1 TaxID=1389203 RepID=A0A9Q3HDA3_9BASI|nr:hypothetical protein [Austropuccinia psidii MF-1]